MLTWHGVLHGIAFTGDPFGSAAYLAELLPIYLTWAMTQIATQPPVRKTGMEIREIEAFLVLAEELRATPGRPTRVLAR